MKQITLQSEEARVSWGETLDKAHAGTEVVIRRHKRNTAVVIGYAQLQVLKERLAKLEAIVEVGETLNLVEVDPADLEKATELCREYIPNLQPVAT